MEIPSTVPSSSARLQFSESLYVEQIGMTFTQNFTSIGYNVTAVEQVDPTSDTGPVYLLNGLSNNGYWVQLGLSWDWTPGAGFAMNYEVFDPTGESIIPPEGGGGMLGFSGPVDPGDIVTLTLRISSDGLVIMRAEDLNTSARALETFLDVGGSQFVGLANGDANSNGFFTGLMTEWYHGEPYYSDSDEVVYSSNSSLSSGWLWMDELNADDEQLVFVSNTTAVITFTANPTQLQELSYGSITEYADAYELITGTLSGSSTTSTTTSTPTATASTATVTVYSTETVSTAVPVTIVETTTATATATSTATVTVTDSSPQPATTTTTTVTTTHTTAPAALPIWTYWAMAALLLVGLGAGSMMGRSSVKAT